MTTEENKKFYELFPEIDICPNCGGKLEFEDGLDTFFVILWIQGYN